MELKSILSFLSKTAHNTEHCYRNIKYVLTELCGMFEHFWLLCVSVVLFISDESSCHPVWYLETYTLKYSKLEFGMLFSCTGAKLWKNMRII